MKKTRTFSTPRSTGLDVRQEDIPSGECPDVPFDFHSSTRTTTTSISSIGKRQ
jgi:hypothetical protein